MACYVFGTRWGAPRLTLCPEQAWKSFQRLEDYGYLIGKAFLSLPIVFYFQVVIDPIALGDCTKRKRIYIALVHKSVKRKDINSHADLERALKTTLKRLHCPKPADPNLE